MMLEISQTLLLRARSEYLEMPGLKLSPRQAAKLLGIDPEASEDLLARLVESGFLRRNKDGLYMRSSPR